MSDILDNVLDRRLNAEEMFAGCVWANPEDAISECGWLSPDVIHDERVRDYWRRILAGEDPARTAVDVSMFAPLTGWYMAASDVIAPVRARPFAEKIVEEAWLHRVGLGLSELAILVGRGDITAVQGKLGEMAKGAPDYNRDIPTSTEVGLEFAGSIDDENVCIQSFIPRLDKALGGLWRQTLAVLCARPGVGKTALAWQIARNVASNGGRAYMISLEMSKRNLWARAVCGAARIPYREILARRIDKKQRDTILQVNEKIMAQLYDRLYIDDKTGITTSDVWKRTAQLKPDLVVVDHIRLLADTMKYEKEHKRLGLITWNLKQIAKQYNVPVLALAQLNRNLESRDDKRPTMTDLRDSGEIEENADFVLGLHRERRYVETPLGVTPADLLILKFRDGPADIGLKLEFDGLGQWFSDGGM